MVEVMELAKRWSMELEMELEKRWRMELAMDASLLIVKKVKARWIR